MAQDVSLKDLAPDEIVPPYKHDIKRTFKLFWPIFLGQLATTSMGVVDTVMAGLAGTIELSGVAIGASFYWPTLLFVVGMTFAIQPTIAQLRGSGRYKDISSKMHLASVLCLTVSVLIGVLVMFLPLLYRLMDGIDQDMVRIGQGYLIAIGFGMPGFALYSILRGYWEGLGYTLPTLIFGFIALFLNIPLNYIFIFGAWGVPAFGGIGCGIATTITMYFTTILALIYVKKHPFFAEYPIYQQWFKLSWPEVKSFLHFSLPLAFSTTIEVTCFSLVALLLSPFGPVVVASHSIAMNVSGLIFMIPMSIAAAATVRVGEAMGALHWHCAKRTSLGAIYLAIFFYICTVLVLIFGHDFIISLYSKDPEVMFLASLLLLYCAAYQLPDCLQAVSIGILRGFKDSRVIFIVTIVSYWIIGMPIGYSLAYGIFTEPMAAQGFWIGFICALSAAFLFYALRLIYLYRTHKLPKAMQNAHEI